MRHTERTQTWLDGRVAVAVAERSLAGRPYDSSGAIERMPVSRVLALARSYSILTALATVDFGSCLDVGSGEGRLSYLIATLFGAHCVGVDLSREFAVLSRRNFGTLMYAANAGALPFGDQQFDVVVCSEVLEHVEHPFAVLAELWRVARHAIVITTQEACRGFWHRRLQMATVEDTPHAERNYFLPEDFSVVYGAGVELYALLQMPERIRLFTLDSAAALAESIRSLVGDGQIRAGSFGVLVIARKAGAAVPPRVARAATLELILETDRRVDERVVDCPLAAAQDGRAGDGAILPLVPPVPVCPECRGSLEADATLRVRCRECVATFPVDRGVPVLLGSEASVARSEAAWAFRSELEPLRCVLSQRPLPWRVARMGLRAGIKLVDFLRLPLPWRAKLHLGWRYLTWR